MRYPNFCGPSYVSQSPLAMAARSMLFYPERIEVPGGKNQFALYPTPGCTLFAQSADTPGRAIYALSDGLRCYAVIGRTLFEVNADMTLTARHTPLAIDPNPAQLVDNGTGGGQLAVASGGEVGILALDTNVFTPAVVTGITFIGMLDGYFLGLDVQSGTLKVSDLLAGLTWDPNQFAQRSAAPDPWRSMLVRDTVIYLIGGKTGDVWYNNGSFPFPFAPIPGIRIRHGTSAPFSLADLDSGPVWLSHNDRGRAQVVQVKSGYRSVPVSTHAVDFAIRQYPRIDDAVGWTYQEDGHEFYCLNFPTAGATWCWDPALGAFGWHERGKWNPELARYEAWGPQYHAHHFGKHLVLDHRGGSVYRMANDVYTDVDGGVLRRMRRAPGLLAEQRKVFYDRVGLYVQAGVGLPG
ncbi:MAG: hypothetical protein ACRD3C_18695, partial [Vicinamibacterales bacterium]